LKSALLLSCLILAAAARAEDVSVDVVVDFNAGAARVEHPVPAAPAYYAGISLGYRASGGYLASQGKEPPAARVQSLIVHALSAQGYRLATRANPPSLLLVFRWGVMAPRMHDDRQADFPVTGGRLQAALAPGTGPNSPPGGVQLMGVPDFRSLVQSPGATEGLSRQMLSLVAGDTLKDRRINADNPTDIRTSEIVAMARQPRYYVMVTAYDYAGYVRRVAEWKRRGSPPARRDGVLPLWEARISTEAAGRTLGDVLPTLVSAGAPMMGRETREPKLITLARVPEGTVEVGTPTPR
jgi:hypothetical protein